MSSNDCTKEDKQGKDGNENMEERYIKLKNVAIRLKKQLADQRQAMQMVEEENKKLFAERDDKRSKSNNAQILQGEVDRIQDLLEIKTNDLKIRDSELLETAKQLSETKMKLTDSYVSHDSISCSNKELEKNAIILEKEVENLKKIKEVSDKNLVANDTELSKLRSENSVIQDELSAEMQTLKKAYQQASANLLADDNEEQLASVLCQLEVKNKEISSLKAEVFDGSENLNSLKEQVILVNEKSDMESARAESLMVTVSQLRKELGQLNEEYQLLLEQNNTDKSLLVSTVKELNDEKLNSINANKSSSISEDALINDKLLSERQVKELEELLVQQKEETMQLKEEISLVKSDFEAYKARAKSVLNKKAKISEDEYSQVLFDRQQLDVQLKEAENSLQLLRTELSACKAEIMLLRSDKASLSQINKSISTELCNLKESFQKEIDVMKEKLKSEAKGYRQIVGTMDMHVEVSNKLQHEIESLKDLHLAEVNTMKEQIKLLENSQPDAKALMNSSRKSPPKEQHVPDTEETKIDFSSMVREDGEGSECVEPPQNYHPRFYQPPTLEHLISRPLPAETHIDEDTASTITDISLNEFTKMESKVSSFERNICHLSNLLSESEAENSKLIQLSDVLKESIRNSSRRELREEHLKNNEYLKNVLIKFLYLKTGDEKKRLVPVLQTILQLSPQEVSSLTQLASGVEPSQNSVGWGSYLHLWSNN